MERPLRTSNNSQRADSYEYISRIAFNHGRLSQSSHSNRRNFDDTVLYRLLSSLSTSFELYSPDNIVMIYLKQHSQALRWEHKFDFRPPKEKERDKSDHKEKDSA